MDVAMVDWVSKTTSMCHALSLTLTQRKQKMTWKALFWIHSFTRMNHNTQNYRYILPFNLILTQRCEWDVSIIMKFRFEWVTIFFNILDYINILILLNVVIPLSNNITSDNQIISPLIISHPRHTWLCEWDNLRVPRFVRQSNVWLLNTTLSFGSYYFKLI